jgi:tetratricopeptide (TPR) repeat protein
MMMPMMQLIMAQKMKKEKTRTMITNQLILTHKFSIMKKLIAVLLLAVLFGSAVNAQEKNIVSAKNYLGYYNKDKNAQDLIEAKKFIDLATDHPDSKTKAKMWATRGTVYMLIAQSKDPKVTVLSDNPVDEAARSFGEAVKLDEKNNFPEAKSGLSTCIVIYFNKGIEGFQNNDYNSALVNFEKSVQANKEFLNVVDTNGYYNAMLAANNIKNWQKVVDLADKLIEIKYGGEKNGAAVYSMQAMAYSEMGNDAKFLEVTQKGRAAFPNDKGLIINELNYYLKTGKNAGSDSEHKSGDGQRPEKRSTRLQPGCFIRQHGQSRTGETCSFG